MNYLRDYEEFLDILNKNKVKYLVVGAYAFAFYVKPRATVDMDIWISRDKSNAARFYKAVKEFGISIDNLNPYKFEGKNILFSLGREPYALEVFTEQGAIDFETAWKSRKQGKFGNTIAYYLSKKHLIAIKKYYNREKDKLDIKELNKN